MKNDRSLLFISFFTFITVLSWIVFEFMKTTRTSTVTPSVQQLIAPLTPDIDTATLNILEQKKE